MDNKFKVGMILENPIRQFSKIISRKNGVYGLSEWSNRINAEKATVAYIHLNIYGLQYANVRVVETGKGKSKPNDTINIEKISEPEIKPVKEIKTKAKTKIIKAKTKTVKAKKEKKTSKSKK